MSTNKPIIVQPSKDFLVGLVRNELPALTNEDLFDRNLLPIIFSFTNTYDYAEMKKTFWQRKINLACYLARKKLDRLVRESEGIPDEETMEAIKREYNIHQLAKGIKYN